MVGSPINNSEDQIVPVFCDSAADDLFRTDIGAKNHRIIGGRGAKLMPEGPWTVFRLVGVVNAVFTGSEIQTGISGERKLVGEFASRGNVHKVRSGFVGSAELHS